MGDLLAVFLLQQGKNSYIERLHDVCSVRREEDQIDLMVKAFVQEVISCMTLMAV